MLNLALLAQCVPFVAHATGKSMEEIHALSVAQAINLCGQHGVKLLTRATDLQEAGTNLEQALCVAEILALQPLAEMFKPALPAAQAKVGA